MTGREGSRSRRAMLGAMGASAAGAGLLSASPEAALASAPGGYEPASSRGIAPSNTAAAN